MKQHNYAAVDLLARVSLKMTSGEQPRDVNTNKAFGVVQTRQTREEWAAKFAFFAVLFMHIKRAPSKEIPTMAIDGATMFYNEDFVKELPFNQLIGVVVHELMHCVMRHHTRMGQRHPFVWNIACDLAINYILLESGFELPDFACVPGVGTFKDLPVNLSAEEYYLLLTKDAPQGMEGTKGIGDVIKPSQGSNSGSRSEGEEGSAGASNENARWDRITSIANQYAKQKGNLPGNIKRFVDEALEPKVDWKSVLRNFVANISKNDYLWSKPNRRYVYQNLYLPGLYSEELGDILVVIDTSGSINDKILAAFASEIQAIMDSFKCKIHIVYHDHAVQGHETFETGDLLKMNPVGGGGTSHVPVFNWINEQTDLEFACVLLFTDMESSFPEHGPPSPVLWLNYGRECPAPFGSIIKVT